MHLQLVRVDSSRDPLPLRHRPARLGVPFFSHPKKNESSLNWKERILETMPSVQRKNTESNVLFGSGLGSILMVPDLQFKLAHFEWGFLVKPQY